MKKIIYIIPLIAMSLISISSVRLSNEVDEDERVAKLLCKCGDKIAKMTQSLKEDPASVDLELYMEEAEKFEKCIDPEGKMKAKEEAMNEEEKKAYGEKMKKLVNENCPDIATALGLNSTSDNSPELLEEINEEESAKLFCECGGEIAEMYNKMKEDPNSVDMDAFMLTAEKFGNCIDPEGKMKAKEEAMNEEEKKAYGEKMQKLVLEFCPDIARAIGM